MGQKAVSSRGALTLKPYRLWCSGGQVSSATQHHQGDEPISLHGPVCMGLVVAVEAVVWLKLRFEFECMAAAVLPARSQVQTALLCCCD